MKEKMIFLDIDGTLLDSGEIVYPSTREAIRRAYANGHKLFLCTGRQRCFVDSQILDMGLMEGVFAAGANIICDGKMIFHSSFEERTCKKTVELLLESNSIFALETVEGAFIHGNMTPEYKKLIARLLKTKTAFPEELPDSMKQVDKIVVFQSDYSYEELQKKLRGDFQVVPMSYRFLGYGAEIMQIALNKASGIQKLLAHYSWQQEDTIGVGDGANDIEMLEYCNISVAMGNAEDNVKEKATFVTEHIAKDGIYHAFEKLRII